jgi:hypothetical protein
MDTWEYEIMPFPEVGKPATITKLDELGKQGWELVSIFQHPDPKNFDTNANAKNPFFATLKRRL